MIVSVPSYTHFFAGSAPVAGALVGLLFVALSVAPERLRATLAPSSIGRSRPPHSLPWSDALFVSMAG